MMRKNSLVYRNKFCISAVILIIIWGAVGLANEASGEAGEWAQWRGPNRDGKSAEKILKNWPADGPKELWRKPIGSGFSGLSVSNGRLYTMAAEGKNEFTVCFNSANGEEIWRSRTDSRYEERQGGDGPRTTPVIDDETVYTMSAYGKLYALNATDGSTIWQHDLQKEFGAQMPIWGFSATPILEDGLLMTDVGGKSGYSVMAFDKKTGEVVWHSQSDQPGYSSPIVITADGIRQVLFFTGTKLLSVSPQDGKLYWEFPWTTDLFVNASTPLQIPGNRVFISSNYGKGAALVQLQVSGSNVTALPVWQNKKMRNHMATCVFHEGYLYGFDNSTLVCMDVQTGEERWKKRGLGKGTLLYADGHFIVLGERGQLVLIEATPEAYREAANAGQVLSGRSWTVPTLVGGKLYLRNLKEIVCLDLKETS